MARSSLLASERSTQGLAAIIRLGLFSRVNMAPLPVACLWNRSTRSGVIPVYSLPFSHSSKYTNQAGLLGAFATNDLVSTLDHLGINSHMQIPLEHLFHVGQRRHRHSKNPVERTAVGDPGSNEVGHRP